MFSEGLKTHLPPSNQNGIEFAPEASPLGAESGEGEPLRQSAKNRHPVNPRITGPRAEEPCKEFLSRTPDPLRDGLSIYHPTLIEFYNDLRAIVGGAGMEGKQTKIFREILSVPAIEESLLRGHLSIDFEPFLAVKTVAEQMQRFRDSLEYARHIVDLYPYGSPDVKYVEAIKYLLDELDRAERKNLSVPLHSPAGVPIVAGESTFRVDEITVRRPSAVEKLLTLGSALPQVEELRGVGTGAFSRVDCVEGLLLNLSDLLYWAGEETDYLWEGDRYSGNLRVAGLTPR